MNFLMVIMASGIARGRVCTTTTTTTTTTTESHKMAAILQVITETCSLGLPFTSLILDIHVTINDTCQNKVSADQYHITISRAKVCSSSRSHVFLKLTADQVLVFDLIAGSCHVNLLKTGQDCLEACLQ